MEEISTKILDIMFDKNDTVCVSDSKFGYHSVPLSALYSDTVTLVSPNPDQPIRKIEPDKIVLVALNPIKGWRTDENAYKYKNFLFEIDYGSIEDQRKYFETIGLPYSALIFSGNKSIHALVSLDESLPSESVWRTMAEWGLSIATACDQNTKNPSRSIRFPGNIRPDTGKKQELLDYRGLVALKDFADWLAKHPEAKPKPPEKRHIAPGKGDMKYVKEWAKQRLVAGLDPRKGRNKQWFAIACEFALAGYSEDDTMDILSEFFTPDRTFREREWKTSIKSAFKYIYARKK